MAQLYLECGMGAAGDMLCAALYELLEQEGREAFLKTMNNLGLPQIKVQAKAEQKCGIQGTRMVVTIGGQEEVSLDVTGQLQEHTHNHAQAPNLGHEQGHGHHHHQEQHNHPHQDASSHHHEHGHTGLNHIHTLIQNLALPHKVKENALKVYALLGEAEAHVHGRPVEHVHFHEVGTLDAIADIVGFCLLMEMLQIEKVTASPLHVGSGRVRTSHGVLPVPAPATAYILRGVPTYSDGIQGELVTPTGAALIKHFAVGYGPMPPAAYDRIGYGMGKKNFTAANCVRAFLDKSVHHRGLSDTTVELRCTVDDMTPEAVGFATETLLSEGARDVYVQSVYMKKNRPGFEIVCLCSEKDAERMAELMLRHTTTLGVRKTSCQRFILERSIEEVDTLLGKIRIKRAQGYGVSRIKPEYDDVAQAAKKHGIPFSEAYQQILDSLK